MHRPRFLTSSEVHLSLSAFSRRSKSLKRVAPSASANRISLPRLFITPYNQQKSKEKRITIIKPIVGYVFGNDSRHPLAIRMAPPLPRLNSSVSTRITSDVYLRA